MPIKRKTSKRKPRARRPRRGYRPAYRKRSSRSSSRGIIHVMRKAPVVVLGTTLSSGLPFPVLKGTPGSAMATNPSFGNTSFINMGTPILNASGNYDIPLGFCFNPTHITNYSEFTPLFDKVRLNKVMLKIYFPYQTGNTLEYASDIVHQNNFVPQISWVLDRDDNDVSTLTEDEFRERMGVRYVMPKNNSFINIKFTPNTSSVPQNGTVLGSNIIQPRRYKGWYDAQKGTNIIDSSINNLQFFGLKMIIHDIPAYALSQVCKFDLTYSVSFKDVV